MPNSRNPRFFTSIPPEQTPFWCPFMDKAHCHDKSEFGNVKVTSKTGPCAFERALTTTKPELSPTISKSIRTNATEEFSSPLLLSSTKPRSFSFLWPVLLRSVDVELPKHFLGNPGSQCAVTPLRASRSPAATCDTSRTLRCVRLLLWECVRRRTTLIHTPLHPHISSALLLDNLAVVPNLSQLPARRS